MKEHREYSETYTVEDIDLEKFKSKDKNFDAVTQVMYIKSVECIQKILEQMNKDGENSFDYKSEYYLLKKSDVTIPFTSKVTFIKN